MGLYEYARGGGGGLSNIISQIKNDIESPIQKHAVSSYVKKLGFIYIMASYTHLILEAEINDHFPYPA